MDGSVRLKFGPVQAPIFSWNFFLVDLAVPWKTSTYWRQQQVFPQSVVLARCRRDLLVHYLRPVLGPVLPKFGTEPNHIFFWPNFLFVAGVINKGDSFRRRRSRSNSLAPHAIQQQLLQQQHDHLPTVPSTPHDVSSYRVALVGTQGVGKTALISQFMTSECINAYDQGKSNRWRHPLRIPNLSKTARNPSIDLGESTGWPSVGSLGMREFKVMKKQTD